MSFNKKSQNVIKPFCSGYISMDSPEHDIIVFDIPVIIAIKNQSNAQWLKNSNSITENLPFDCEFSTMKK